MGQKAITIFTPDTLDPHIFAEDDAQVHRAIFGGSGITDADERLAATIVDNNTIRLASGLYSNMGYLHVVPAGETLSLTIGSGTSGVFRRDLIISEFIRGGGSVSDTLQFRVLQGEEASTLGEAVRPTLTQDNIAAGGSTRQEALYEVVISGVNITELNRIANYVGSFYA